MAEVSKDYPEEIWFEILKRLPSKSLCRFLSVSKQWCRLITTKYFISSHLNHNLHTQTNTHLFLRVFHNHSVSDEEYEEEEDEEYEEEYEEEKEEEELLFYNGEQSIKLEFPLERGMLDYIVGTCNGLVCLTANHSSNIILWNPSVHKFVTLPESSHQSSDQGRRDVLGFGVNLLNGYVKVLRVSCNWGNVFAEVYSHQTGKWVEIKEFSCNINYLIRGPHLYLNGRSHFIGKLHGDDCHSLISFDMSDEVFRQVPVPEEFDDNLIGVVNMGKPMSTTLGEEECLAIAVRNPFRCNDSLEVTSIWVMKEYGVLESWTKMYNIDLGWPKICTVVGFMKNGDILMRGERNQLLCFDRLTGLISKIDIFGSLFHAENYVESLVLLQHPCFDNYDVESLTTSNFIQLN